MANYTKGERQLYCGDEYWIVEVRDKPNRPTVILGRFNTKEDAVLDAAAPDMYEALKLAYERCLIREDCMPVGAFDKIRKALRKAEGKNE